MAAPREPALVAACILISTSGNRTMPIDAMSMKEPPPRRRSPAMISPILLSPGFSNSNVSGKSDGAQKGDQSKDQCDIHIVGLSGRNRVSDHESDDQIGEQIDGDHPVRQARPLDNSVKRQYDSHAQEDLRRIDCDFKKTHR